MSEHVYVVSDLHLGGRPAEGEDRGFQLCIPEAQKRLAAFIHHIGRRHGPGQSTELVINGDFVDFLAEEDRVDAASDEPAGGAKRARSYSPFTADPVSAGKKLASVLSSCSGVFAALRDFLAAGHRLTLLLGNHDLELSMPPLRRQLEQALTEGRPRNLTWLIDGEAYAREGFLIEHGNRYDGWNAVHHGELRAFRSALSRGEPASFEPPPGSRLVCEVMNSLKEEFAFVDLLKPENEALVPVLIALRPDVRDRIRRLVELQLSASWIEPKHGAPPTSTGYIAAGDAPAQTPEQAARGRAIVATRELVRDADDASGEPARTVVMRSLRALVNTLRGNERSPEGLAKLEAALRLSRPAIERCYALDAEEEKYLAAAQRLGGAADVVVFGHTHLPKSIRMAPNDALYLNPGTWCPTVGLSPSLFELEGARFREELENLLASLRNMNRGAWMLDCRAAYLHVAGGQCRGSLVSAAEDGSIEAPT